MAVYFSNEDMSAKFIENIHLSSTHKITLSFSLSVIVRQWTKLIQTGHSATLTTHFSLNMGLFSTWHIC
jgi:hypothetical protein